MANANVKAWGRAARKEKGKDAALGPMFGATWGNGTFEVCNELKNFTGFLVGCPHVRSRVAILFVLCYL